MSQPSHSTGKSQAIQNFERVVKEAPRGSSEYRLYYGKNTKPLAEAIKHRIDYLENRARHLSTRYRQAAIALLQEELSGFEILAEPKDEG
jgi:hypothetical protein